MAKVIKFNVKLNVDGKEQLATATTSVKELSRAFKSVKGSADEIKSLLDNINRIGFAFENVADVVGRLTEGVNSNLKNMAQAAQLTGKTGGELRRFRAEAEAVAGTFGKDFGEVMRSVNALAKGFGVSTDEALRLVRDGMVSGADAGGDFLDTVREYPRYFKEAGLSAEDFIAITANAAKQGVFSDKGVDTIKEANLRLREMTTATAAALEGIGISAEQVQQGLRDGSLTTFEVMQQVAARLKELPPSASEVGTAIADIFGGPGEDAGLEYIKTLADVKLSMADVKAAAGDTANALDGQVSIMTGVKEAVLDVADALQFLAPLQPFVGLMAQTGMALTGLVALKGAIAGLNLVHKAYVLTVGVANAVMQVCSRNTRLAAAASVMFTGSAGKAAAVTRVLSAAMRTGAYSATALKLALRGLISATVVGAAVALLTAGLEKLIGALDSTGDAADEAGGQVEALAGAHDAYVQRAAEVQVQLDREREKLGGLIKAGGDTAAMVEHLNGTYGEAFGTYQTAADWYDVLTRKSRAYAMAMGYQAEAQALATEAAKASVETETLNSRIRKLWQSGGAQVKVLKTAPVVSMTGKVTAPETYEYKPTKELTALRTERDKYAKQFSDIQKRMATANAMYEQEMKKVRPTDTEEEEKKKKKKTGSTGRADAEREVKAKERRAASLTAAGAPALPAVEAVVKALEAYVPGRMTDVKAGFEGYTDHHTLTGKAAAYGEAEEQAGRVSRMYEIGIIGADEAQEAIDNINASLAQLDGNMKPVKLRVGGVDETAKGFDSAMQGVQQFAGALGQLGGAVESPELNAAATMAQALATLALSFSQALSKAKDPLSWIAFGAAGLATLAAITSAFTDMKGAGGFAAGGIVGGSSYAGDRLTARVNSGEMILTRAQQRRLFDIIRGAAAVPVSVSPAASSVASSSLTPHIYGLEPAGGALQVEVRGRLRNNDIALSASRAQRVHGKAGRKY